MEAYINEKMLHDRYSEIEQKLSDFSVKDDYDLLEKNIIDRFIKYGREDISSGQYERAIYVLSYLEGKIGHSSKEHPKIYRYKTHKAKIDGFSMLDENSRPIFYLGYGHFDTVKKDMENLQGFGANTIQVEIGPSNVIYRPGTHKNWNQDEKLFSEGVRFSYEADGFEVRLGDIYKDIIPTLEKAEKENIAVVLLISPHYLPEWIYQDYPDIRSNTYGFFNHNIYHPVAKRMMKVYIDALIPLIRDYKSLQSICISNEPVFNTAADYSGSIKEIHDLLPTAVTEVKQDKTVTEQWIDYLEKRYADIDELNRILKTKYNSFSQVEMPQEDDKSALFYQWQIWNNEMFTKWHKEIADMIKEYAPDIPVHAKIMPSFGTSEMPFHRRYITYGVDPQGFATFSDISGNDAWTFLGKKHLPLSYKFIWYDYLASIKKMPIDNSEDHVIEDRDTNYSHLQAKRTYADMWQGALHGRTISQLWVWERDNNQRSCNAESILNRPDCVEAVGRAMLDLNRLAYQATAMQNVKPKVAILYSKPTRIYEEKYIADMFKAYEAVLFSGNKAGFVFEDRIDELCEYELVIIPGVTNASREVKKAVAEYVKSGKKAIVLDRNRKSFSRDEYNNESYGAEEILSLAEVISADSADESPNPEYSEMLTLKIKDMLKNDVEILCSKNYNLEWFTGEYEGKTLVSIANHNEERGTVSLPDTVGTIKELISQEQLESTFCMEPYACVLLELS